MQLVNGTSGKVSAMRVASLFVVVTVMMVFLAHNIMSMIRGGGFVSIGPNEAMLVAGVLAAKAAQRFGEKHKFVDNKVPPVESSGEILPLDKSE